MPREYRYQLLENQLRAVIREQRILPGERLPSVRNLCRLHQASRATVLHALQRLEAQGLIEARPKSGFYVRLPPRPLPSPPRINRQIEAPQPVTVSELLLDIMRRGAAFDLLPGQGEGDVPAGITALNRSVGRALRRQHGDDHQYYDEPAGLPVLREQLAGRLARRGAAVHAGQLCITSGCQHSLFLGLMACCRPGDVVAVESPGFYGVLQLLEQLQLQAVEIPSSSADGMDMDALEMALQRWPVRACVVSPAFSTPTGALLPEVSRQRLLALAEQYDLAVIEDDIYADTAFSQIPDPLLALDYSGRVILCGSFSKSLSRDLRLGWIAGGRWHQKILQLKLVTQLASGRALQQGVADFLADGSYSAHLRRQRYLLCQQRDQLLAALREWPVTVSCSVPEGGLALWVVLPPTQDTRQLYCAALAEGIVITPGPLFSVAGGFRHCLRLSFAHQWNAARLRALQQFGYLLQPA